MAKVFSDQSVVPSVFDRLLDDEPGNQHESPHSRLQLLRDLKQSVRRDLEHLLNTRWSCEEPPNDLTELEVSLVNYGIPDFTGVKMSLASQREELRHTIEHVIRRFEPRLASVKVAKIEDAAERDGRLRFRIDAMLQIEPAPEPVVFDSQLEPTSATFHVKSPER